MLADELSTGNLETAVLRYKVDKRKCSGHSQTLKGISKIGIPRNTKQKKKKKWCLYISHKRVTLCIITFYQWPVSTFFFQFNKLYSSLARFLSV